MLRRPGGSWGFVVLLKGTSVVVFKVERALYIHSPPPPTIPAGPRIELTTFQLRFRLSNHEATTSPLQSELRRERDIFNWSINLLRQMKNMCWKDNNVRVTFAMTDGSILYKRRTETRRKRNAADLVENPLHSVSKWCDKELNDDNINNPTDGKTRPASLTNCLD